VRRELERIEIPGEHDARPRTWETVRAAYEEREPVSRPRSFVRPLFVAAAAAALVAAAASPTGRAVIDGVGDALGVRGADESLFSLPAAGRLLVVADSGLWVVSDDGSKRRLGEYGDAAWSPFGRFVVATRRNELVTLKPDGDVRWKLSRRGVTLPRWGGSRTDTRIAYLSAGRLHVVGGDGRGDRDIGPAKAVAPAWRPGPGFVLAYATPADDVIVHDVDTGATVSRRTARGVRSLRWADGRVVANAPQAEIRRVGQRSDVIVDGRVRFSGTGTFTGVFPSPDMRWLVVGWRDADQWLFISARGPRRVRAVANITEQFDARGFPLPKGWVGNESS
jgi:hypothetical protein